MLILAILACAPDPGLYPDEPPLENVAFNGPGWTDGALDDPQETYWAAVTLIQVADAEGLRIRDHWTRPILEALYEVDGHVGHRIDTQQEDGSGLGDDHMWAATYTVWESESALDAYVASEVHLQGNAELGPKITNFSSGRWQVDDADVPEEWEDYWERLEPRY